MDALKNISSSKDRDIIIQLSYYKSWADHVVDFIKMREQDLFYELHVKDIPKTSKGCRCYLSHEGVLRGWVEIYSIVSFGEYTVLKMFPYINKCEIQMASLYFKEPYRYFYNNSFDQ